MRKFVYVTAILFSLVAFIFSTTRILAQETSTFCGTASGCENLTCSAYISCLESKTQALHSQANTLSSQIAIMDNQVRLTEAQIANTKVKIADLEKDIDIAKGKVGALEKTIEESTKALLGRIAATYQVGTTNPWEMFLTSGSIENFFTRLKYLRIVQAYDKKTIYAAEQAKTDYENQKAIFEDKQAEAEALNKKLEGYTAQLDRDKRAKKELLTVTKNNENTYQGLLDEARSILTALSRVGAKIGDVKKGDIIASAGSTGCSTGPHLHFEVYERAKIKDGQVVDKDTDEPIQFKISSHLVNPLNYINSGQFQHPLPGSIITTGFQEQYFLGSHTGIDLAYLFSVGTTKGKPIFAAENGVAYLTQDTKLCSGFQANGIGKGVIIDHQNGLVTLYWHIQ